ncbi:Endopolyphosphatase [Cladophialophora chaetospira]|uniref:Endopolyphosphatase n=1 Tax=Cladophialophora chaetospira TaxID=386627 RepID=A0AA38X630_9EURO|nr:Endopolyphosphatase [Cladophialophora chaetospira]
MVRLAGLLLCAVCALAAPPSIPLKADGLLQVVGNPAKSRSQPAPRKLRGRFLHITDIHPDPFYKARSDVGESCHSGKGDAGIFGAEATDCDTPVSLVNATFRWIEENLKDDIDFVIWTGDSARHDNDERFPRSDKQVLKSNRFIVDKFVETFGKPDNIDDPDPTNDFVVPIVPTFGNNDILPHNIFNPGPNKWTRVYLDVWNRFVPQAQRHSFSRGGWFFSEVIPNKLAVFSLNTLYFFESNSAVDGCDLKSEPGYHHMEWLRAQLQFLRVRGMKAILIGHVPPARTDSKQNWDESCYQKYTLWMRQYRDVIITSIFGHMNIDHFIFQDVKSLKYKFHIDGIGDQSDPAKRRGSDPDKAFTIAAKGQYLTELRSEWSELPTPPNGLNITDSADQSTLGHKKELRKYLEAIGGPWAERYSLSLVSPSVVPNFFPTLRVIEYNITGLENDHPAEEPTGEPAEVLGHDMFEQMSAEQVEDENDDIETGPDNELHDLKKKKRKNKKKKKKKGKKKKPKKPPFPVPQPPSTTAPPGPAYSPQSLSLLSFTQYYANLTKIQEHIKADKKSKHDPEKHFKYKVEYTTNDDKYYQMKDLTVLSWIDLAERIGRDSLKVKDADGELMLIEQDQHEVDSDTSVNATYKTKKMKNRVWKEFIKRAFVHTKPDEEIDQEFG